MLSFCVLGPLVLSSLVTVTLTSPPSSTSGAEARLVATRQGAGGGEQTVTGLWQLASGQKSAGTLALGDGDWTLQVHAKGYWAPPVSIRVPEDAAIHIRLFPTARVTLAVRPDSPVRESLGVSFRSAPEVHKEDQIPGGQRVCETGKSGAIECEVPVGISDLRFEARNFIPEYVWSFRVQPGRLNRAPGLMEYGASVSGFARSDAGAPLPGVWIEAMTPMGTRIQGAGARGRNGGAPISGRENALFPFRGMADGRGFFQIRGVPAGEYRLVLPLGAQLAAETVNVRAGIETRLPEALVPRPVMSLDVTVEPATMPDGSPWRLTLSRLQPLSFRLPPTSVPPNGEVHLTPVAQGTYALEVWGAEDRWFYQAITVEEQPGPLTVRVPVVHVEGKLTLAGQPLVGSVVFGGRPGSPRHVSLSTDEDGMFEGHIPGPGDWPIGVVSSSPAIERRLRRKVEPDSSGNAVINIDLPGGSIRGRVVDAEHKPARATVFAYTDEWGEQIQVLVGPPKSEFSLAGLPPGPLTLQAQGEEGLESEVKTVLVGDGSESAIEIVLQAGARLVGRVADSSGTGLPGATVKWLPVANGLWGSFLRSDAEGRFTSAVPLGLREATILFWADGYAMDFTRVAIGVEQALVARRDSGQLTVAFEKERSLFGEGNTPFLVHAGTQISVAYLWTSSLERSPPPGPLAAKASEFHIAGLAPGNYRLCSGDLRAVAGGIAPTTNCVDGFLSAGTELRLTLPER